MIFSAPTEAEWGAFPPMIGSGRAEGGRSSPAKPCKAWKQTWMIWMICMWCLRLLTNWLFFKGSGLALVPVFNNYATKKLSFPKLQSLGTRKRKLVAFRWWVFGLKANVGFPLPGHAAQAKRWCLGLYCQERWAMPTSWNCQRFRSHDLPFPGFWHKLIGK